MRVQSGGVIIATAAAATKPRYSAFESSPRDVAFPVSQQSPPRASWKGQEC